MLRTLREEKGSISVLVALAIICLLGFTALVADMGLLYLNRIQLSNMADSAALAGAQELPTSADRADETARTYAKYFEKPGDVVDPTVGAGNTSLTVNATRTVNFLFARVLGIQTGNVSAQATASLVAAGGLPGPWPFGVPKAEIEGKGHGDPFQLKAGAGGGKTGNYGLMGFDDQGGGDLKQNIINGYKGTVKVGDMKDTEPGNKDGPSINQGLGMRIPDGYPIDFDGPSMHNSKRFGIVPIIPALPNGREKVKILGFAAIYITGWDAKGNVEARVVKTFVSNDTPETGEDFGVYSIRLTQ